jgi:hypothetical protein
MANKRFLEPSQLDIRLIREDYNNGCPRDTTEAAAYHTELSYGNGLSGSPPRASIEERRILGWCHSSRYQYSHDAALDLFQWEALEYSWRCVGVVSLVRRHD